MKVGDTVEIAVPSLESKWLHGLEVGQRVRVHQVLDDEPRRMTVLVESENRLVMVLPSEVREVRAEQAEGVEVAAGYAARRPDGTFGSWLYTSRASAEERDKNAASGRQYEIVPVYTAQQPAPAQEGNSAVIPNGVVTDAMVYAALREFRGMRFPTYPEQEMRAALEAALAAEQVQQDDEYLAALDDLYKHCGYDNNHWLYQLFLKFVNTAHPAAMLAAAPKPSQEDA